MKLLKFLLLPASLFLASTVNAAPFNLLLESNDNRPGGSEIFMASFDDYSDLLSGSLASSGFSQLNIGSNFGVGGLAYDGQYRLLLESNDNRPGGSEIFMASFNDYSDLLSGSLASSGFSQLNIGSNFGVGGLAYDGQYQLLLESNDNRPGGSEIFMASFDDYSDLLSGSLASSGFSQLNIGSNFGVGGLAYDGQYQLLLESNDNRPGGSEIFMASFDDYSDLLSGSLASSGFSQLNIGSNFGVGGLVSPYVDDPAISTVPVPATVWLFSTALIGLVGFSKRKKAA